MPDLDTELAALRHRMRDTIEQPDLADIAARARQRTARRRTQWTATAAVLVVVAAVPLLRGAVATEPPADQTNGHVMSINPHVVGIEFVTPSRGYAIESNCPYSRGDDCRYDLLTTTDGGGSWAARPLPPTADGKIYTRYRGMDVIGEDEVLVDRATPDDRNERILSDDGGRTWSVVAEPFDAAATSSISGVLVSGCPPTDDVPVRCDTVGTLLADGRTARLTAQPALINLVSGYYPTTEGTWWVRGVDPSSGELALAVSRDDGRTWTTRSLGVPVTDPWRGNFFTVAEHDGTLYAAVRESNTTPASRLMAMFVSADGGRTWSRSHAQGEVPRSAAGDLVVTPSGDVLVNSLYDNRKTYVTRDGVNFAEAEEHFRGIVWRVRAGYVELPWRRVKTDHAFSVDGVRWRPFTVG